MQRPPELAATVWNWVSGRLYYPLSQWLQGEYAKRCLPELERSQWFELSALQALQQKRLSRLFQAAQDVPFYREQWARLGVQPSPDNLTALPLLAKDDIRLHGDRLEAQGFRGGRSETQTSGSSGTPLHIYQSREFRSWHEAGQWRARRWYGLDFGAPTAVMWGRPIRSRREKAMTDLKYRLNNMMGLSAFDLSASTVEKGWRRLERFRPRLIYAYPSALNAVALLALEKGWRAPVPPPAVIMTTAETLHDHERVNIERAFGCPVANVYGCAEMGAFAHQCPQGGMHVAAENVIVEIVQNGRPVPTDELGEIVVTSLNNYGMPLIRYQNGDAGRLLSTPCPCGRTLPLLDVRVGKVVELVQTVGGQVFSSALFDYISKRLVAEGQATTRFRVVQRGLGTFTVMIVPGADTDLEHVGRVFREVLQVHVGPVDVSIEAVSELPRDDSGKLRYFVSEMGELPTRTS